MALYVKLFLYIFRGDEMCKKNLKLLVLRSLATIGVVALMSNAAQAADPSKTNGYWAGIPNSLFPGNQFVTYPPTSGADSIFITTAENNPDVWCADQGQGYRTPYAGDMNELHLSVVPPLTPANGKTGNATRKVSKSLYNEWGDVTLYIDSGWDKTTAGVWVAEPASQTERRVYLPKTGGLTQTLATNSNFVACVTDI